jgi:hypothetical protein
VCYTTCTQILEPDTNTPWVARAPKNKDALRWYHMACYRLSHAGMYLLIDQKIYNIQDIMCALIGQTAATWVFVRGQSFAARACTCHRFKIFYKSNIKCWPPSPPLTRIVKCIEAFMCKNFLFLLLKSVPLHLYMQ